MAKCIMVQGTMSGAGKSLLATALCRIFHQDGWRVAPFKSQNMALNSYITRDGLEMGRAQVAQAEAAGREPDVRMNPILLKPSSDVGSQLIVNGEVRGQYRAVDYFRMKRSLIPDILAAYDALATENDVIVIEGAGSPAEINLKADDIVNMGLARLVDAPVVLVGDIDRGGVFAQLYGTVALLEPEERARIVGTIINKFRGDVEILRPGLSMLEEKTGLPVLGVIPYTHADIDDEDSLAPRLSETRAHRPVDVAVIRLPRISNFTDFSPLESHPALGVRYVSRPGELGAPDLIILPGTKNTMADLLWLRQNGLEAAIQKHAASGAPVLGVCGGYQMLGRTLSDPDHVEHGGSLRGIGLLPVDTVFSADKARTRRQATVAAAPFSGVRVDGYEIHMGRTVRDGAQPFCRFDGGGEDGAACGNVYGTYLHGLFDTGELTGALADALLRRRGLDPQEVRVENHSDYKQRQYDLLADAVRANLDMAAIYRAMGLPSEPEGPSN
ncbi:MAG: cobyric acid synthase [Clostridia bacterium]|nr:cobyric acid synthase [Clostridia bacterium]